MADEYTNVREGLATNLGSIPGLQEASGYMLSNPTPPAAEVTPAPVEYDLAMGRGVDKFEFDVRVFTTGVDVAQQKSLDRMLASAGDYSVKAALESDTTLGGVAHDLRVVRASGYRTFNIAGRGPVLGAEWRVEVYVTPS